MLLVHLICSDDACTEEFDVMVENLDELDGLVCDCGFGTATVAIAEVELV